LALLNGAGQDRGDEIWDLIWQIFGGQLGGILCWA
jgi:hypothetical protein